MTTHLVRYDIDDRGNAWCSEPLTPSTDRTDDIATTDCAPCVEFAQGEYQRRVDALEDRMDALHVPFCSPSCACRAIGVVHLRMTFRNTLPVYVVHCACGDDTEASRDAPGVCVCGATFSIEETQP